MIDSIHQSTLGMWLRCGEQFSRRYLEGEIIPPGVAARRGSAFHKAAEINHRQKIVTREDLPAEDLKDAARDEFVRLVKEEGVYLTKEERPAKARLLNEGLNQAVSACEVYRKDVAPKIVPKEVERRYQDDIGVGLPLVGTVDCVTEGYLVVYL